MKSWKRFFSLWLAFVLLLVSGHTVQVGAAVDLGKTTIPANGTSLSAPTFNVTEPAARFESRTLESPLWITNTASNYPPAGGDQGFTNPDTTPVPTGGHIQNGTLLGDHFGVTLELISPWGGGTNYAFDPNSLAPTRNTGTVDWVEDDWYGNWNSSNFDHTTVRGKYPSGAEWYDVEALYFDNDATNFYVAIVTSSPHYEDWGGGHVGVGVYETRVGGLWIRSGDLSLNLYQDTPRTERNGTSWHYNYGVDITHENRDQYQELDPYRSTLMRDDNVGQSLYKTTYDLNPGGGDNRNPSTSDWYVSTPVGSSPAYYEHTNFDPQSSESQALGIQYMGETTVNYYEYPFPGGLLENGAKTYVYEVTIPRSLLGADNPGDGDQVGIRWVEGCRNDGNETEAIVNLVVEVDDIETGDAPDSTNHDRVGMSTQTGGALGSANYPTVSSTAIEAGGGPHGMCHAINPDGLVLGTTVSAEADADRLSDEDGQTNLDPAADVANRDSDDGLTFPAYWMDGTTTVLTYTVTAPATAADGSRYVNIWADWNRDGDWADHDVSCAFGSRDEHLLVNQLVDVPNDVAPGSTVAFQVAVTPCNPILQDRAWIRITLSDEPLPDPETYQDDLASGAVYSGSSGTLDWSGQPWSEVDDDGDPNQGDVQIVSDLGDYSIRLANSGRGIWRQADLSAYSAATLSFEYRREVLEADEAVAIYVSSDGGSSWAELDRLASGSDSSYQSASYDISGYVSPNTAIRFLSLDMDAGDWFFVDSVQILARADDGRGPGYCFAEGETEDYLFDPTLEFGDAPDSSNNDGQTMTAYSGALPVTGNFPSTANPALTGTTGMCHVLKPGIAPFLGAAVTAENTDADRLADADPVYNILPLSDLADNDGADDGLDTDLMLEHCQTIQVPFSATVPVATGDLYVNMWFDWNRDGDWGDPTTHTPDEVSCPGGPVSEWAAQNLVIPAGTTGVYHGVASVTVYNPSGSTELWARVTLTRDPVDAAAGPRQDGSGPGTCVDGGETEDYLLRDSPTAVDLLSFAAAARGRHVLLTWETASEVDNLGFFLYRRLQGSGQLVQVSPALIPSQVPGQGQGASYSYLDEGVQAGAVYEYFLQDVDANGTRTLHGPVTVRAHYAVYIPLLNK